MKKGQLLWDIPSKHGDIKVLVQRGVPLIVGDKCMFYNSISEVLEIQNPDAPPMEQVVSIKSQTRMSEEDAEFFGLSAGWGEMTHGFSVKQMAKLLGSTCKEVGVPLIDEEGNFIE